VQGPKFKPQEPKTTKKNIFKGVMGTIFFWTDCVCELLLEGFGEESSLVYMLLTTPFHGLWQVLPLYLLRQRFPSGDY
jgi:hypothetical protein